MAMLRRCGCIVRLPSVLTRVRSAERSLHVWSASARERRLCDDSLLGACLQTPEEYHPNQVIFNDRRESIQAHDQGRASMVLRPVVPGTGICSDTVLSVSEDGTSENKYQLPVGRALRYINLGRHYYRRHDGDEEVQRLLKACKERSAKVQRKRDAGSPRWDACVDEHRSYSTESHPGDTNASDVGSEEPCLEEVRRFVNYHCHRVITTFKKGRVVWTDQMKRRRQVQSGEASSALKSSPAGTSPVDAGLLMEYIFSAGILLHLTGLFGVGEKYVEPLLAVCFSCSVFLSQILQQASQRECLSALPESYTSWNSLHWGVVHYCEGVRFWELVDHSDPFQSMQRTSIPYARLLQAHTNLLLHAGRASLRRDDWHHLLVWRGSTNGSSGPVMEWFGGEKNDLVVQQRRLQLLPLFWLSLMTYRVHFGARHPCGWLPSKQDTAAHAVDHELSWSTLRHAFLRILPLFSREAKMEPSARALAYCLYTGKDAAARANHGDMAVLLSSLERHDVLSSAMGHMANDLLHTWLRQPRPSFIDTDPAVLPVVEKGTALMTNCRARIKNSKELYMALRNIPQCAVHLPADHASVDCTLVACRQRFVSELLLSALLQWRISNLSGLARRRLSSPRSALSSLQHQEMTVSSFIEELSLILEAAHHLCLLRKGIIANARVEPEDETNPVGDAVVGDRCDALLMSMEAAARALIEQLSSVLYPVRLWWVSQGGVPISKKERLLIGALHVTLMEALNRSGSETHCECHVGIAPRSYWDSITTLMGHASVTDGKLLK